MRRKIQHVLDQLCKLDCPRKNGIWIEDATTGYLERRIPEISTVIERPNALIMGKYYSSISNLLDDLRLFCGSNAVLFTIIWAILLTKAATARCLTLPAALLFVATVASIAMYIFGQNWFHALSFSRYMSWTYLAYAGAIFAFLLNIAFNEAAITSGVTEVIASLLEGILNCLPSPQPIVLLPGSLAILLE